MKKIKDYTNLEKFYLCYIKINLMFYYTPSSYRNFWFDSQEIFEPIDNSYKSYMFALQMSSILFFPFLFLFFDLDTVGTSSEFLPYYLLYIFIQSFFFYIFNKNFRIEKLCKIINYIVIKNKISYWEADTYFMLLIIILSIICFIFQKFFVFIFNIFYNNLF